MTGKLNSWFHAVMIRIFFVLLALLCFYYLGLFVQQQMLAMGDSMVERHQQQRANQQAATLARESATARADQQRAAMAAHQAEFEAARRRAFDSSYQAPARCNSPSSERQLKACANHKMRARQRFFSRYDPGPYGTTSANHAGRLRYEEQRSP